MKRVLLLSFDIIREGECSLSYSIASLLANVQSNLVDKFKIENWSINISNPKEIAEILLKVSSIDFNYYDKIAVSTFVWADVLVKNLIKKLRENKFSGEIILGGRQITYNREEELYELYPECHIFIKGYGEASLLKALMNEHKDYPVIYCDTPLTSSLISPYLSNILDVENKQKMVRMETKRGCIYSCNFCAHKGVSIGIEYLDTERVFAELDLFKERNVGKINIIDPIFNYGEFYISILKHMIEIDLKSTVSLQCKFELIEDDYFLELCSKLNVILEFGVQTTKKEECKRIDRINQFNKISQVISRLNEFNIDFEVSLIYGLPHQTLESFKNSIAELKNLNCKKIVANPLMLLRGTKLYEQKETLSLKEKNVGDFDIPLVVESPSFSEEEWIKMNKIAYNINNNEC